MWVFCLSVRCTDRQRPLWFRNIFFRKLEFNPSVCLVIQAHKNYNQRPTLSCAYNASDCVSHGIRGFVQWDMQWVLWNMHTVLSRFYPGQFWPPGIVVALACVCVCQSWAYLRDNSSPVPARITEFVPGVQNTLVRVPIVWGRLPFKVKFNFKFQISSMSGYSTIVNTTARVNTETVFWLTPILPEEILSCSSKLDNTF